MYWVLSTDAKYTDSVSANLSWQANCSLAHSVSDTLSVTLFSLWRLCDFTSGEMRSTICSPCDRCCLEDTQLQKLNCTENRPRSAPWYRAARLYWNLHLERSLHSHCAPLGSSRVAPAHGSLPVRHLLTGLVSRSIPFSRNMRRVCSGYYRSQETWEERAGRRLLQTE